MTEPVSTLPYAHERAVAEHLAREAAVILLYHRRRGFTAEIKTSEDDLVTVADKEASELIVAGLRAAFPGDGILSEELLDDAERLSHRRVWIIDPIDGTSEYVKGSPDYCVSIGLSVDGEAVLGVVLAPEGDELFTGVVGQGVWKNGRQSGFSGRSPEASIIAVSDTEHARELNRFPLPSMMPSGSIALKMARIAAGEADATFTMSPRSEWDIAAGMALISAAGGVSSRRNGMPVVLNSQVTYTRRGILAGRRDVVEWLKPELLRLSVPEQVHAVTPADDVWALAPQEAREGQQAGAHLHLRHAGGALVAWALVRGEPGGDAVLERSEGDAHHAGMLLKDTVRIYGPMRQG